MKKCIDCQRGIASRSLKVKRCLSCAGKVRDQFGNKNPSWKGGIPNCLDCGKRLGGYQSKRCHSCSAKISIRARVGEKHPRWKGGITPINKLERTKFREIMQKQEFKRDNYKCVFCGNGGNLQVDHIQSWADYVELRFSLENCRTLCMSCHYLITFQKPMDKKIQTWGHNMSWEVK